MKKGLLYIWQLPQHLLALILIITWKPFVSEEYQHCTVFRIKKKGMGVSLGKYIFLDEHYSKTAIKHEYGHSIQSRYFGWIYLLAIGIPSAVFNNLWDRLVHKNWSPNNRLKWYYRRYPEKWADKLGGVIRNSG
jgi:hypothetical protein